MRFIFIVFAAQTIGFFGCYTPPKHPSGYEYCDSAAVHIVQLDCVDATTDRVANACRAALDDGRDWHPKEIATASTCEQIGALVEGHK